MFSKRVWGNDVYINIYICLQWDGGGKVVESTLLKYNTKYYMCIHKPNEYYIHREMSVFV